MSKDQLEKINVSDHMKINALPAYKISNDDINNIEDKSINIPSDTKKLQDDIKHLLISYNALYKSTADNRSLQFAQILYEKHVELFTTMRTALLLDNVNIEETLYKLIDESLSNLILDNEIRLNESKKNITDKILDLAKKYSNLNASDDNNQVILKDNKLDTTTIAIDNNASNDPLLKHNITKLYNKINISINEVDVHISKKILNISKLINNNHFNNAISDGIIKMPFKNNTYNKIENKNNGKENKNNVIQMPLINNRLQSQKNKKRVTSQKQPINILDSKKEITIALSKKHSAFKLLLNIGSFFKDIKSILNVFKIIVSAIKKIFNMSIGVGIGLIKKTFKVISDKTKKILSASAKLLKSLLKGALVAFFMSPMGAKTIGWIFGKLTKLVKKVSEYAADLFKKIKEVFSKVIGIANKVFNSVIGFFKKPDDSSSNSTSNNNEKPSEDIEGQASSFANKIKNLAKGLPDIFEGITDLINNGLDNHIKKLESWSNIIIIGLNTAYLFYSGFSKLAGLQKDMNTGWITGGFGGLIKGMFNFTFSNTLQDVLDTFVPAKPKKRKLTIKNQYIDWYPKTKETTEDKQKNRERTGKNLQNVKNINSKAILSFDENYDLLINRDSKLNDHGRSTYKPGSLAHLYSLMSGKTLQGDKDVKTPVDDKFAWNVKGGMFGTGYVLDIFYNNVLNLSKTDIDDIIDIENKKSLSIDSQYEFIKQFIMNQKMFNDFIMHIYNSSNKDNKAVLNEFFLPENNVYRRNVLQFMLASDPKTFNNKFMNLLYAPKGIELLLAKDEADVINKKNNIKPLGGVLKILFSDFNKNQNGDISILMTMKFKDKTILSDKLSINKKIHMINTRRGRARKQSTLTMSSNSYNTITRYNDILNYIFGTSEQIISAKSIRDNIASYGLDIDKNKSSPEDLYKNINIVTSDLFINSGMIAGLQGKHFINKINDYDPAKYANLFNIDIQELQKHIQDYDTDAILDMIKEKEISEDIIKSNSASDNANSEYLLYAMTQILNAAKTQ